MKECPFSAEHVAVAVLDHYLRLLDPSTRGKEAEEIWVVDPRNVQGGPAVGFRERLTKLDEVCPLPLDYLERLSKLWMLYIQMAKFQTCEAFP